MASSLGMGAITSRSIGRWRAANGKSAKPWRRKVERGQQAGDVMLGAHPTKGVGWRSRHGKRSNS